MNNNNNNNKPKKKNNNQLEALELILFKKYKRRHYPQPTWTH
jgi:hypothetical protein